MIAAAYNAPTVRYPFAASPRVVGGLVIVSALGLVLLCAWLLGQQASAAQAGVGIVLWVACSAVAWRWWRATAAGELVWDGCGQWLLNDAAGADEPCTTPEVCCDLQAAMLLRLRSPSGRSAWLWLEHRAAPARWMDLRRAVIARQRSSAVSVAMTPDAARPVQR